jgi:hypothetical protein
MGRLQDWETELVKICSDSRYALPIGEKDERPIACSVAAYRALGLQELIHLILASGRRRGPNPGGTLDAGDIIMS